MFRFDPNSPPGKGIDEILMRTDYTFNPTAVFYYQQDHQGSVTHLTNASGSLIEKYRYDVFGAPSIYPCPSPYPSPSPTPLPGSAASNRFMFTGREYAAALGFYEYRARAYHPGLGRFTSEDPKGFDAGDYNLYRYCHNDPLDMTDPMGLGLDNPPPPVAQWAASLNRQLQNLARQARDLAERAQSTSEMEHSYLGSARWREGFESYKQGLSLAQTMQNVAASNAAKYRLLPLPGQTERHGQVSIYRYQLADSKGTPIRQADWEIQERLLSSSPPETRVSTSEYGRNIPLTSKGIFRDAVGLLKAPPGDFHTSQIFGYKLWRYGYPSEVSTQIRHDISRVDGVLQIDASIYKP